MNKNNTNDIVNDLLKFLLCELKEKEMSISHYRIQKTIFKIKKELGENHPLYEFLPYYWYKHGPFSNVVANQFKILTNSYSYSTKTVFLNDESLVNKIDLINDYPIIKEISEKIFENKNDFFNKFDETIYIEYAPFSFMYDFKYKLFELSRNNDLIYSGNYDDYLNIFYDCLTNLPYDNLLNDFSILFSRLFTRLEIINDENQFFDCWKYITGSIQQSWYTFARWVSINNHDAFYNNDVSKWKNDLEKKVELFNNSVNYLEDKTDYILNDLSQFSHDSFDDKVYNATIRNYLTD